MPGSLLITKDLITEDFAPTHSCEYPNLQLQAMTARALLQQTMQPIHEDNEDPNTPAFYHLDFPDTTRLDVYWIGCKEGHFFDMGNGAPGDTNWFAFLPDGQLATRFGVLSDIVTMRRESQDFKPQPSFDCAKASSPTEKAICTVSDLWVYDRHEARSYKKALAAATKGGKKVDIEKIKTEQRASLQKRIQCGTNVDCLRHAMANDAQGLDYWEPEDQ